MKPVGEGVSEMRIDYGPRGGYRVYFTQRGDTLVVLLAGGDKRTQPRDIELALDLARNSIGGRHGNTKTRPALAPPPWAILRGRAG